MKEEGGRKRRKRGGGQTVRPLLWCKSLLTKEKKERERTASLRAGIGVPSLRRGVTVVRTVKGGEGRGEMACVVVPILSFASKEVWPQTAGEREEKKEKKKKRGGKETVAAHLILI